MTPRSLIEAALLDQAARILAAHPRDLMARSALGARCVHCGGPLGSARGAGRRNQTGFCSHSTACRTAQQKASRR